ncbi:MAG: phosphatidylglycerophosphatase A [Actinomycetota bacterium]
MHRLVASSLGLGLIPRRLRGSDAGAGIFGAALGAAIGGGLLAIDAAWWVTALTAVALSGVSVWAARPFAGKHDDPGWVCIDETAGTVVALVGLSGWPWVVALVVARLADIFKVLPGVAAAERLPGAVGITADDILAGLYGLAAGWGLSAAL